MNYTHLTQDERDQIYILLKAGHHQIEIAQLMKRHPTTISRELARNSGQRGYRPKQAQHRCDARTENCRNAPRIEPAVWAAAQENNGAVAYNVEAALRRHEAAFGADYLIRGSAGNLGKPVNEQAPSTLGTCRQGIDGEADQFSAHVIE